MLLSSLLSKRLILNRAQARYFTTEKKQFLAVLKDYKDPQCLERRMGIRDKHFSEIRIAKKNGGIITCGALLDNHESSKMEGSFVLYNADSIDEVEQLIKNDHYYKTKVWEKWEIYPVKCASI
ncbi:uncharacterized protein BX663DRAFT_517893 [Cokeromyces recurvatus]|uniref:uncharacterized protein n=1 Tax=Cokeromyces recurvatus TaxID=90255 RepID=UPI00221EF5DC|nr:uncharacterized protein BX663DRAFT_517893 [Cokeromyces recurvatus]KAI7900516.1 hypothetical protein BX663DRAFT_517893 [Cokeromyces recurvatus]